jgi:cation diffusion facilitator family transporter
MVTATTQQRELLALRLSSLLTTLFAAAAILIAIFSDSETMTLEAMSGVVDVLLSLLAIFVIRKVHEPANSRYHFGYAKYEPLMTAVEGILLTAVCASAIGYAVRDFLHPDAVDNPRLVIVYSALSFLVSVVFGVWMRRVGRQTTSQLVTAEAELWIVEGWLALGVFVAFAVAEVMRRTGAAPASAYVDPAVCVILSLILLRKPYEILKESLADLVDANPYAETVNAVEDSARAVAQRFGLKGLEWVRVRKAGRRVFVMVSFFEDADEPLQGMDRVRQAVTVEMSRLNPDVDVSVLFRTHDASRETSTPPASAT